MTLRDQIERLIDRRLQEDKMTLSIEISNIDDTQARSIQAMLEYWEHLGNVGGSRRVSFDVDGDGAFRPKISIKANGTPVEKMSGEEREKYVISDEHNGNKTFSGE